MLIPPFPLPPFFGGSQKRWFSTRVALADVPHPGIKTGTRVHSDVPPGQKLERGYVVCTPGTKTTTRVHLPKSPFYETALSLRAQRLEKFKIALRDENFQARLKISSEPRRVSLSSGLRSHEGPVIQMGGALPYKLEVYCRTFFETGFGGSGRGATRGAQWFRAN